MTNWIKIEEIAKETLDKFSGYSAKDICTGDCSTFAKIMTDSLKNEGIDSIIVLTDNFGLMDELEGYETRETDYSTGISHCYVEVDGWFFDAFDLDGCEKEDEMAYHIECIN